MKKLGLRIKELREKKDLSQKDLSTILNVQVSSISRYESGERLPPPDKLEILADFFGVSLDFIMGRTDNPIPTDRKEITLEKPDDISQEAIEMARSISEISQEQQDLLIPYIQAMINEAKKKI